MSGLVEGKELGLQKGWEIGHEIGFYAGCVQVSNLLSTSHCEISCSWVPLLY